MAATSVNLPSSLVAAASLAKNRDTRHLALEDPSLVLELGKIVEAATANEVEVSCGRDDEKGDELLADTPFENPKQVSPIGTARTALVFSMLRDCCAGCRQNQDSLHNTGLPDAANLRNVVALGQSLLSVFQALGFAINQITFLCSPASQLGPSSPAIRIQSGISSDDGSGTLPSPSNGQMGASADLEALRRAIRAALQFLCNFCVGNEANQAFLWAKGFSRAFMVNDEVLGVCFPLSAALRPGGQYQELVNGLKSDRPLLALAVALLYNCCLAPAEERDTCPGKGRERLRELIADRAFCCLLMKVVPFNPRRELATMDGPGVATGASVAVTDMDNRDDPAAEWLYLLFHRFAQEHLLLKLYDAVGIRVKGGIFAAHHGVTLGNSSEGGEECQRRAKQDDGAALGTRVSMGTEGVGRDDEPLSAVGHTAEGARDDSEDFFPVTPEQLVVLNLAGVAAGDAGVVGGEEPSPEQRQTSKGIASWLESLLISMPMNQNLNPRPEGRGGSTRPHLTTNMGELINDSGSKAAETCSTSPPVPSCTEIAISPPVHTDAGVSTAVSTDSSQERGEKLKSNGNFLEAEATRLRMREEARSATLRALAALLAGCDGATRERMATRCPAELSSEQLASFISGRGGLLPLCLRLLVDCGGRAQSSVKNVASRGGVPSRWQEEGIGNAAGTTRQGDFPTGRKAELIQVIGNACFRCRDAQDFVREIGGLPLILNHCAIDDNNPLLREYALLAVRNLCEGNLTNQASIAALQPQGHAPDTDDVLRNMGVEGRVDAQGRLRITPHSQN